MQAVFGINREKNNALFYREYTDIKGTLQFHSQIELCFIDEGESEVYINNHRRNLRAGEMSVALSYDTHAYRTPEYSKSALFIIPIYLCEEFINTIKHKRVANPFITDKDCVAKIRGYIREIIKPDINPIKLQGYIYIILGIIMDSICFERAQIPMDTQLSSKILFYLNDNFKSNISLAQISENIGYSESYISRYFKACFNVGISRYLTVIRLKNALMLMQEKKHQITYCALESGFNSMRTFYRAFYDELGCSPREYMALIQSEQEEK